MTDKHSLNYEVRELKLGASFTNNKASQYHTIKYDFKPASVDVNKMATVDVGTNNQVTVTVPHLDGAGIPQTVFKGNQRPYTTKECVLIIDRVTGEITLEKLSSNIQVKKTRQETSQKPRPLTPVTTDFTNTTQRSSSRTRVATNKRTNPPPPPGSATGTQTTNPARFNGSGSSSGSSSGAGSSAGSASAQGKAPAPQNMVRSPLRLKTSPPQAAPWSGGGNSTLASLPMIGLDEALAPSQAQSHSHAVSHTQHATTLHNGYGSAHGGAGAVTSAARPPYVPPERGHTHPLNPHPVERQLTPAAALPVIVPPTEPIHNNHQQSIEESSSSSSSDSDSGSGSGSDSDSEDESARSRAAAATARLPLPNNTAITNGTVGGDNPPLPSDVLNDDLCLSESGSDSD